MKHLLTAAVAASLCGMAWAVAAQDETVRRKGPLAGISLGVGSVSCDRCARESAPALDLHVGWAVSGKLALTLDRSVTGVTKGEYSLLWSYYRDDTFVTTTAAAQYWLADRVWLSGGIGATTYRTPCGVHICGNIRYYTDRGLALTGAAGVELIRTRRKGFALDVQARVQTSSHALNPQMEHSRFNRFSGQIGVNWYRRHRPRAANDTGRRPTDSAQD